MNLRLARRRRARVERRNRELYNGHQLYVSREEPNKPVVMTCRLCGYETMNLDASWNRSQPTRYWPLDPIKEPCTGGN